MERWIVQLVIPKGQYEGAQELIAELTELIELNSNIEVVSVELDPDFDGEQDTNQSEEK